MGLCERLTRGSLGVTFATPPHWELDREGDDMVNLADRETGTGWYLFFFPGLQMDLDEDGEASLKRDVEVHANALFEAMRRRGEPAPRSPRSPLVSCEAVTIEGGRALSVIHRMAYQPGSEIVMGHLLVPLASGLFEARWIVPARQTGFRESVMLMKAMEGGVAGIPEGTPPEEIMKLLEPDAPEHDALFPDHVLSIARAADRWSRQNVKVIQPATAMRREHALAELGCDLVVPPRFGFETQSKTLARFGRVSIAGNDGVQVLTIERCAAKPAAWSIALARCAEGHLGELGANVTSRKTLEPRAPLASALVMDAELEYDRPRVVVAGFVDALGGDWLLSITTTESQEPGALLEELAALAESTKPHARRPWWKVWG
ncbi:MAG: hypothetical protein JST00_10050 [Deltaproteobacteria bacterium]|nr:hypothetical protein [Deltaproteobacteria bacterium]